MALVETQMVSTQDVFLPYMVPGNGRTLAEKVRESPQFLLGEAAPRSGEAAAVSRRCAVGFDGALVERAGSIAVAEML